MNVKYPMTTLTKKPHLIERLEVQSFEMNVYLVKVTIAGESGFVTDIKNSPMRFHNSHMFSDMFDHCDVQSSCMTQVSPYY